MPAAAQAPRDAFRQPDAPLGLEFRLGESVFRRLWVEAPSSTRHADGLGPLYNARSCQSCHPRAGRGPRPEGEEPPAALILRLSVPPATPEQQALLETHRASTIPDPSLGTQLQPLATAGLRGEGRVRLRWHTEEKTLADGTRIPLRRPEPRLEGPAAPGRRLSLRMAPALIGLGLLEQVPEAALLALADPTDRDGDGIRGRLNRVWSQAEGRVLPGRFGWKAGEATLADQNAAAFSADLGLSTPLRPAPWGDCTAAQPECRAAPHGLTPHGPASAEESEVEPRLFALLTLFTRHLAVPPRPPAPGPGVAPGVGREVARGEKLFASLGCGACHRPRLPLPDGRAIAPYTDLLLHDMGEALADHRPEGEAGGRDWRTPPLWGLGRVAAVSGPPGLLHDGRARSVLEAILWHGGEALPARERVRALPAADRAALLAFLDSL
nr:di-heme oxidoredictase family protein [Roseomonas sp. GC11]